MNWEYLVEQDGVLEMKSESPLELTRWLNQQGAQGLELVTIAEHGNRFYFKRPCGPDKRYKAACPASMDA